MHCQDQGHGSYTRTPHQKVTHRSLSLAEELLIRETLDVRSIQTILGQRPFPINKTFEAYLETEQTI